jgi:acetyl-CoA synthetase
MSEKIYDVPAEWATRAWVDQAKYQEMYARSVSDPDGFWAEQANRIGWMKHFTKVENTSFAPGHVSIKWFEDGVLNVAWNCIDRHLEKRGDQTAIIWEGDNPSESKHITYRQLHDEVCKMANILRTRNVKKGDRVTIYLPMIPEAAYAMLACARIGAIHSVVFAGFSPDSLAQRINDCQSKIVITADEGLRGGKKVPLKSNVDAAIAKSGGVDWVVVVKRTGAKIDMNPSRDGDHGMPVRAHACRGSAVHPLYLGLDRPAQGRAAHVRRLPGVRVDDASIRVRLSRRRRLLVHRRRRLGHRPQLHSLRAAGQRRDHADVRGRAELPR